MTETVALDCCPFCDGVAQVFELSEPSEYVVCCDDCGASSAVVVAIGDDPTLALAQLWNRRHHRITAAVDAVLAERARQIHHEGWSKQHDDTHVRGEMADAAGCYALMAGSGVHLKDHHIPLPRQWPWDARHWKPSGRRRDLIKAGALILAEIERLDRQAMAQDEKADL